MSRYVLPPQSANVTAQSMDASLQREPVTMIAQDGVPSRGLLYSPEGATPRVGVHLLHPRTDQSQNYNIEPLAKAGYMVLGRGGRSVNNDVDTVHEEILLDFAAGVRLLRDRGCEKVILLGNSGGGSLAALYQAQARTAPPGRLGPSLPYPTVDLNEAELSPADAVVIIGGHAGEAQVLLRMIDPSVVDESDPLSCNADLDMYRPTAGFRMPPESSHYSIEFIQHYRRAQLERVLRIDAKALQYLEDAMMSQSVREARDWPPDEASRLERRGAGGRIMVIYRTLADPASADMSLDPDDRSPVGMDGDQRPDLQNYSNIGPAHYLTPRAWLSTWSGVSSHANTAENLKKIADPTLIVHYCADWFARLADADSMLASSAAPDKTLTFVPNADHYGRILGPHGTPGDRVTSGTDAVLKWLLERLPPW